MFDRFARSWALVKASASVLRQDKELLVFPLVSSIAMLIVVASFVAPVFFVGGDWQSQLDRSQGPNVALMIWAFAFYFVQYAVMFFFNSALVGAAMIRLRGGDPTVGDGFRIAFSKLPSILGYAAIAATVGMILKAVEERAPLVGRIVASLVGTAWTLATFLAVPVLVAENIGPFEAVKKSATLLKKTWGENLIGNAGIGFVMGFLIIAVLFVGIGLGVFTSATTQNGFGFLAFAIPTAIAVMLLFLIQAALHGVYAAAVYRFAEEGAAGAGFDAAMLQSAFRAK